MLILDIDYLDTLSEASTIHINGSGKAFAISNFWVVALGGSTYAGAVANNQAFTGSQGSFASSSVQAFAAASGGNVFVSAASVASVSN
ncbi:hypothetical protein [Fortiea contorta]|uniref:hypothetical protein n=1 Tax=Fortiea contorta TaxID=1892405 RepID=UPI000345158D|nr:hypothetical protein [Fortiea contorta]